MQLAKANFPETRDQPIRKAARRLRWFIEAFSAQVASISADTGMRFEIDRAILRSVFLAWVKQFEAQKPPGAGSGQKYITFAAGLMLRELIRQKPLKAIASSHTAQPGNPEDFWPEGHAYLTFCLNVRAAVIAQEMNLETEVAPVFDNIRTWQTFRENAEEDLLTVSGFFELFAGDDPNWMCPNIYSPSHAEANFLRLVERNRSRLGTTSGGNPKPH